MTPYVVAVVLGVLIVAGIVVGVVVATTGDDATMTNPPGGQGVNYTPVWRW